MVGSSSQPSGFQKSSRPTKSPRAMGPMAMPKVVAACPVPGRWLRCCDQLVICWLSGDSNSCATSWQTQLVETELLHVVTILTSWDSVGCYMLLHVVTIPCFPNFQAKPKSQLNHQKSQTTRTASSGCYPKWLLNPPVAATQPGPNHERLIDLFNGGALLSHHLGFTRIGRQHAISHKAIA